MKNLCRAALVAFALTLALAPAARSSKPTPYPSACAQGRSCETNQNCGGCARCGNFCINGICECG